MNSIHCPPVITRLAGRYSRRLGASSTPKPLRFAASFRQMEDFPPHLLSRTIAWPTPIGANTHVPAGEIIEECGKPTAGSPVTRTTLNSPPPWKGGYLSGQQAGKALLTKAIEFRETQRKNRYHSALIIARFYADLGDKEQAFHYSSTSLTRNTIGC